MYPRPLYRRTEFYHDFMRRMDAVKSLAGVVSRQENDVLNLTVLRREQSPEWTDAEGGTIKLLLPHVARALLVNQRLALLEAGEAVLDTLLMGVSFLSESGRVVSANRAAERMVRSDDGLSLRHGTLGAVDRLADEALQRAIQQAALPENSLDVSGPVLVPRPSMRRPYVVRIGPLRRKLRPFVGTETPVVVALMTDPEEQRPLPADLLVKSFQLTAREAALAVKLAEGHTVEQAAEELQIRYETARTHLRRIFDKTNTNRQTDLVLLLARLTPQASGS
jgi:DNA-binding CsgD family transcriptional regulator